jgi:hypothetical protein
VRILHFYRCQSDSESQLSLPWTGLQRNLTGAGVPSKPVSRFPKGFTRPLERGFTCSPSENSPSRQSSLKRQAFSPSRFHHQRQKNDNLETPSYQKPGSQSRGESPKSGTRVRERQTPISPFQEPGHYPLFDPRSRKFYPCPPSLLGKGGRDFKQMRGRFYRWVWKFLVVRGFFQGGSGEV